MNQLRLEVRTLQQFGKARIVSDVVEERIYRKRVFPETTGFHSPGEP
jgi:hypothetical protein